MQMKDAILLQKRWGNKKCDHPNSHKEYYAGTPTGDFICTQCGKALDKDGSERICSDQKTE